MTTTPTVDLESLDLSNLDLWRDGPPHELFDALRRESPLHWSELSDFPGESGVRRGWSLPSAEVYRFHTASTHRTAGN